MTEATVTSDKRTRARDVWSDIAIGVWALNFEACTVIGLRSASIIWGGPSGLDEATLMVREKLGAVVVLQNMVPLGEFGASPPAITSNALTYIRRKVRANRRRLIRGEVS